MCLTLPTLVGEDLPDGPDGRGGPPARVAGLSRAWGQLDGTQTLRMSVRTNPAAPRKVFLAVSDACLMEDRASGT